MSAIKICIPSYKRVGRVSALNFIPKEYSKNVFLYVRDDEYNEYYSMYSDRCTVVSLSGVSNIGETRQAIVAHQDGNRLWMMDDDVTLHKSFVDNSVWRGFKTIRANKKIPVSSAEFYEALDFIATQMDKGFVHGSYLPNIFPRNLLNFPTRVNTWSFTNTFLDLSRIPANLIVYNKMAQLEDMYQWLTLCKAGFDSVTMINFLTTSAKSNAPGGCSTYRNATNFNEATRKILADFPEYTFVRKSPHSLNLDDDHTRISIQAKIGRYPDKEEIENRRRLYKS